MKIKQSFASFLASVVLDNFYCSIFMFSDFGFLIWPLSISVLVLLDIRRLEIQHQHPQLYSEFKASWGYMRPCQKKRGLGGKIQLDCAVDGTYMLSETSITVLNKCPLLINCPFDGDINLSLSSSWPQIQCGTSHSCLHSFLTTVVWTLKPCAKTNSF